MDSWTARNERLAQLLETTVQTFHGGCDERHRIGPSIGGYRHRTSGSMKSWRRWGRNGRTHGIFWVWYFERYHPAKRLFRPVQAVSRTRKDSIVR